MFRVVFIIFGFVKVFDEEFIIVLLMLSLCKEVELVRVIELGLLIMVCFKGFYIVYFVSKSLLLVEKDLKFIVNKFFYFLLEDEGKFFFFIVIF